MTSPSDASIKLVFRAVLLALLTGCSAVTNTNAPKPVDPGASSRQVQMSPEGLQLGYAWHADSRGLYPLLGVSASAHYGDPVLHSDPTIAVAAAITSAASAWALTLHQDGNLKLWSKSGANAGTIAAAMPTDAAILFSPSGTAAGMLSPSTSAIAVISGLPSKPQLSSLPLPVGSAPVQIAVADDGTILAGVTRPGTPGVQLGIISEMHGYTPLATVQAWGGAAFLPGAGVEAAVFADRATATLTYASGLNSTAPVLVPISHAGLLQKPIAVGVSPDGKWAYAADSATPQVVRVNISASAAAPSSLKCACTPQQIVPLTTDGVFSLSTYVPGKPAWILDARASQPRTFFVPALPASAREAAQSAFKQSNGAAQ
jgi:hypothetical protein